MELAKYIEKIMLEAKTEIVQFEVHLDSQGKVMENGANIVRFNISRKVTKKEKSNGKQS